MAKKGQKNLRGKPEKWDELKKRVNSKYAFNELVSD
jgi:hypothetical protein